jgi:cell shape-determining protein MreC
MTAQFYRPQKEDRGRSRLLYATFLIIIIFLLDLVAGGRLRSGVRLGASYVYVSLAQVGDSITGSGFFGSRASLEAENSKLRSELTSYQQKDGVYAAMQDENTRLRTLVGLAAQTPGHAASIVSSLSASAYGTFTIDVGIEEGVSRGAVVFTPNGFAIGIVSETGSHSALVTELFAPDSNTEAVVGDTHIVLEGQGGGNARAKAPRESTIAIGAVARASAVDAPVGIVEHVESTPTGADKELYIRIPINLQTLTLVYVGRK